MEQGECPLCGRALPLEGLEEHVNECLNQAEEVHEPPEKEERGAWGGRGRAPPPPPPPPGGEKQQQQQEQQELEREMASLRVADGRVRLLLMMGTQPELGILSLCPPPSLPVSCVLCASSSVLILSPTLLFHW